MFSATAKELTRALGLAAELAKGNAYARKMAPFEAISLIGTGEEVEIASHVGDFALVVSLPIAATFERIGIPGARLAGLVGGLPGDGMVEFHHEGTMARVFCKRARFKLPTIPATDLPAFLSLGEEVGRIELARVDGNRLFAQRMRIIWRCFRRAGGRSRRWRNK